MIKSSKSTRVNNAALALSSPSHINKGVTAGLSKDAAKPKMSVQQRMQQDAEADASDISDILTGRYRGISLYGAIMFLLAIGIVWTAVLTAEQVQRYHQSYMALQKMKVEHRKLQVENQRLVIEQQTFSATPQIASRAITELGMYSPTTKDKLILQPTAMPESMSDDPLLSQPYKSSVSAGDTAPRSVQNLNAQQDTQLSAIENTRQSPQLEGSLPPETAND